MRSNFSPHAMHTPSYSLCHSQFVHVDLPILFVFPLMSGFILLVAYARTLPCTTCTTSGACVCVRTAAQSYMRRMRIVYGRYTLLCECAKVKTLKRILVRSLFANCKAFTYFVVVVIVLFLRLPIFSVFVSIFFLII